jgi:hypothetical protein
VSPAQSLPLAGKKMIAHEACYWHRHLQHLSNGRGEPYVLETKRHFEPGRLVFLVGNERAIRLTPRKEYLSDLDVSMGDEGAAAGQNSVVMSGWRQLIKGYFAAVRLIVGAVMSSACRCWS